MAAATRLFAVSTAATSFSGDWRLGPLKVGARVLWTPCSHATDRPHSATTALATPPRSGNYGSWPLNWRRCWPSGHFHEMPARRSISAFSASVWWLYRLIAFCVMSIMTLGTISLCRLVVYATGHSLPAIRTRACLELWGYLLGLQLVLLESAVKVMIMVRD